MLVKISDGSTVPYPYVDANGHQYPPNIADLWTDAQLAALGWARPTPAPPTKSDLQAYADATLARWNGQGVSVNLSGGRVAQADTTGEGRADILGVIASLELAGNGATTTWYQSTGNITINLADAQAIGAAVADHREAIVAAWADVVAKIQSGAITTTAQIDAHVWA